MSWQDFLLIDFAPLLAAILTSLCCSLCGNFLVLRGQSMGCHLPYSFTRDCLSAFWSGVLLLYVLGGNRGRQPAWCLLSGLMSWQDFLLIDFAPLLAAILTSLCCSLCGNFLVLRGQSMGCYFPYSFARYCLSAFRIGILLLYVLGGNRGRQPASSVFYLV